MILARKNGYQALSENSVVGPRASVFSPGKDGEAGDVGFIVDTAGCSQAENKPIEARSSFLTQPSPEKAPSRHQPAKTDHDAIQSYFF